MSSEKIHDQIEELTETYLARGLSPEERRALDAHAGECRACAKTLADATEFPVS